MLVTRRQKRGAEVSAANLSRQLQVMGHTVIWVGLYQPSTNILEVTEVITKDLDGRDDLFFSCKKFRHLLHLVKQYKVDIIQANGSDTLRYAVAVAFLNPYIKLVYRNISKVSYWINGSFIKKMYNRLLFSRVTAIASVGTNSANDLSSTLKIPQNRIKVIRRGIPLQVINKVTVRQKITNELSIPVEAFILVWIGELAFEKNPLFMIDVMVELQRRNINCYLVMTGKGKEESNILEAIKKYRLQNVQLTGYRSDAVEILAAADLLVLTSYVEGVPGVVLEAAMQQIPAVAVNKGGVGEAVIDGKTGILIDDHNVEFFSDAVEKLIKDENLRKKMGQYAYNWVKEEFDEKQNAEAFSKLYQAITE